MTLTGDIISERLRTLTHGQMISWNNSTYPCEPVNSTEPRDLIAAHHHKVSLFFCFRPLRVQRMCAPNYHGWNQRPQPLERDFSDSACGPKCFLYQSPFCPCPCQQRVARDLLCEVIALADFNSNTFAGTRFNTIRSAFGLCILCWSGVRLLTPFVL